MIFRKNEVGVDFAWRAARLKRKEEHSQERDCTLLPQKTLLGMLFFAILRSHNRVGKVDFRFGIPPSEISVLAPYPLPDPSGVIVPDDSVFLSPLCPGLPGSWRENFFTFPSEVFLIYCSHSHPWCSRIRGTNSLSMNLEPRTTDSGLPQGEVSVFATSSSILYLADTPALLCLFFQPLIGYALLLYACS